MPIITQVGQKATTFTHSTFDGKITHIVRRDGETFPRLREIDSYP